MRKSLYVMLTTVLLAALAVGIAMAKSDKSPTGAWLGIYSQSIDDDLAEAFDLPVAYGVIVNEVVKKSPAEKAGLEEDDIIVAFDKAKIYDRDDLVDLIEEHSPGDKIILRVVRDDDELDLPLVLQKRRDDTWAWTSKVPYSKSYSYSFSFDDDHPYLGVSLTDLTDQLGGFFGVDEGEGALITEVHEDSPAEEAGLKAGDVIVAIGDEKTFETDEVIEALGDYEPGDEVAVKVIRDKKEKTVMVEVGEPEDVPGFYSLKGLKTPDVSVFVPEMKWLDAHSPKPAQEYKFQVDMEDFKADMKEFKEEMEQFKDEMKSFKKEMQELKARLQ